MVSTIGTQSSVPNNYLKANSSQYVPKVETLGYV